MVETEQGNKFVYFIADNNGLVKIGVAKNPKKRLKELQTASPRKLNLISTVESDNAFRLEGKLHRRFKEKCVSGEWFELNSDDIDGVLHEINRGFGLPAYPALIKTLEHFSKVTQKMAVSDSDVQNTNYFFTHDDLEAFQEKIDKLKSLDRHGYHNELIVLSDALHFGLFMLAQANGYPPYYDKNMQVAAGDLRGLMKSIYTHLLLRENPQISNTEDLQGWFK